MDEELDGKITLIFTSLSNKFSFRRLVKSAMRIFGKELNEKLFREQLAYFKDIDYTEDVDFMRGFEVADEAVKSRLTETSLQKF